MDYTMYIPGIPVSRWIDGVLEDKKNISQRDNLRVVFFQGHACNSQTRGVEMKKALEKLDMLVISDPYPTTPLPSRPRAVPATATITACPGPAGASLK